MRRVVVSEFLSLDGVMESPHEWTFQFFTDEQGKFKDRELFAAGALLLGRVTYEGFAEAWPGRTDEDGYSDRINSMPKYVATKTKDELTWNSTPIKDVASEVAKLKAEDGEDLLVFGSAELVNTLVEHDLVDEFRLMVYPVVVGRGKHLFKPGIEAKVLTLVKTETFPSGVAVHTYEPSGEKLMDPEEAYAKIEGLYENDEPKPEGE